MLTVAECSSLSQFEALRAEWEDLLARAENASIFSDWTWVEAVWRYAVPGKQPFVLLIRDAAGTLVGVLPLARTTRFGVLRFLEVMGCMRNGYPIADYGGLLAARDLEGAAWAAALDYLARKGGWSTMDLRNCPAGRLSAEHYRQAALERGWTVQAAPTEICRRLALPATFAEYLATLSGNTRQQIRRKLRRLDEDGLRIVAVDGLDPVACNAALEYLFEYHQARWAHDPSGGCFPDERSRALQRYVAPRLAARGELDLRIVQAADGTCAGVMYNYRQAGVGYFVIMGLNPDPRWQTYSLGTCLLASSIEAALTAGCQTFDLLRGDHDYKRHFGGQERENLRITIHRHRWLSAAVETGRGLRRRIRLSLSALAGARAGGL